MPLKSFKCKICGKSAPRKYLAEGKFKERMAWLRKHRKKEHPRAFKKSIEKGVKTRRGNK